jgi:hypothetical protein
LTLTDSERVCVLSALAIRISKLTDTLPPSPADRNPRTVWEINNLESALQKLEETTE